jgi:site-specific DNA-methyltransferase (adenine-specific)
MNELTKIDKDIVYSGFKFKKNGLEAIGLPTFDNWQECGEFIKKAEGSVHLWLGDWLNYGEHSYGNKYTQALENTGYDYGTLKNDSYVAKQVDLSRRRDVPFSILQEIAPFKPEEQERLLDMVEKTKMTREQLRKEKHKIAIDDTRPITQADTNLVLGDCIEYLQTLPPNSVDCLVTDAPYGIDYESNRREVKESLGGIVGDKMEAFTLLKAMCMILSEKIKPNSHLYFFTSWKVYSKFEEIISTWFNITNVLVWDKGNHGAGDLEGNYGEQYELIIFANTGRRILNGDRPTNIICYPKVSNLKHPTEKPVGLIEKLIKNSTKEGEVVLDPFMGSGSTCLAAKNTGRKYIGVEIDEKWYKLAQQTLNN